MRFRQAVEQTPGLGGAWRAGLQALRGIDRARVTAAVPARLAGSVDLDEALAPAQPTASRWDYGIAYREGLGPTERICWLEVHPCSTGEVTAVLRKHAWLMSWLGGMGKALDFPRPDFVWLSSGRTSITGNSPQARRLSVRGIRLAGSHLTIP